LGVKLQLHVVRAIVDAVGRARPQAEYLLNRDFAPAGDSNGHVGFLSVLDVEGALGGEQVQVIKLGVEQVQVFVDDPDLVNAGGRQRAVRPGGNKLGGVAVQFGRAAVGP